MVGLVQAILAEAPAERFTLAGPSMGGHIAFEIMRQAPGRVTRLALLDTSARPDTPDRTKARIDLIEMAQYGRFAGVTDALLPMFVHPERLGDERLVGIVKTMAANVGRDDFVRQERAIISRSDSRPLLADIRVPTLVLCGHQDRLTPIELHLEMAHAIAGATLAVIERCGHLSTLERPAEVNAALGRWLAA